MFNAFFIVVEKILNQGILLNRLGDFVYCTVAKFTVVITVKPVCKVIPGLFEFHLFSIFHKLDNIASQHEPSTALYKTEHRQTTLFGGKEKGTNFLNHNIDRSPPTAMLTT